uniref:Uncharacterized protein n=1 Tax=Knipowitschia caucasica TaxID=637954 RepID=A0AAV2J695_KNICA
MPVAVIDRLRVTGGRGRDNEGRFICGESGLPCGGVGWAWVGLGGPGFGLACFFDKWPSGTGNGSQESSLGQRRLKGSGGY